MSNKRSRRKNVRHFFCPYCQARLWRLGSPKYHFFYTNANQIKQNLQISAKKSAFLATKSSTYLDENLWIEEFFCSDHGKIWLKVSRSDKGQLDYQLALREDWKQTNKTIDSSCSNPSVSEFSYRMSRKGYYLQKN